VAVTFVNEKDRQKFSRVERLIGKEIAKLPLPEGLGEGPDFSAPPVAGTKRPFSGKRKNTNRGKR
jgi:hypothetical protein